MISLFHSVAVTMMFTGWLLFFWKCFTIDVLSSIGRPVDDWHRVVCRWFPVSNDLFAVCMLIIGVLGLFFSSL